MARTVIDLDDDVHADARQSDKTIKDYINDSAREANGIEDLSSADAVERRMAQRESELRDVRNELEQVEAREAELESELDRLEDRLETIEANAVSLEEALDDILDTMLDSPNQHVFAGQGPIKRTASEHDMVADDFVLKLQNRADERDLDIDDARFQPKTADSVVGGIAEVN
jgi:chromosome segregation ATPase